ncbi:putative divergent protein kinase [Acanthamoeba polyphaga moumouvirus]|uniref:Putative divergent protein kinase n=1 Tax=Acanthamoeba polyphaga moumouvirus TaxID=1269028 RepID=L7RC02_9VIRU|nr:putative divergent protein kinase [Acanthamoeba polyphaga moumouvirus]AGC02064.1 putative divergent protein kinase [Acanthamoeba polyphaga moumouvirus]AQN68430.1 putative divergent protein kinase [Saudi moumouvirus]
MNFKNLYDKFHNFNIGCDIIKSVKIKNILYGSGGSNNIILSVEDKKKDNLIVKIIPEVIYSNVKIEPDKDQLEIKFYQFLTRKYVLTDRTPHIVGIFKHKKCENITKLLKNIKLGEKCPTYEETLTGKYIVPESDYNICQLLLMHEMKLLNSSFDMILLEYCAYDFSYFIRNSVLDINNSNNDNYSETISIFSYEIQRILFQLIFTLAIIKDDYPGFYHGDFFVRNILLSYTKEYEQNDYIAYHYLDKIFYLPANGFYSKINDFGTTVIIGELTPNTYDLEEKYRKMFRINPYNKKNDIFNLLHDIYYGGNLGTISIVDMCLDLKMNFTKIFDIRNILSKFINVDILDDINSHNRIMLDRTWNIDTIKILEDSVLSPQEYLLENTFELFETLPQDAEIIKHYNASK